MTSLAVTALQYRQNPPDVEGQGPFRYRLLAESDSWMDKSGPALGALPQFLAEEMNRQRQSVLIINISTAGDTLRRITHVMQGEFGWWLDQFRYDGILLSAGGNDFIDAARDPDPGRGILRDMAGQALPGDGYDCVNQQALAKLIGRYLKPNFATVYGAIRSHPLNAATPIFLNSYDTPTARNAPAAPPATSGSRGDWANEIHPNKSGWRKLARVWAQELASRLS